MDPIRTSGYVQARGFNPGVAPNTAEQQRRQDEEFIRQFKETADAELQVKADELARLKERNAIEQDNRAKTWNRRKQYEDEREELKLKKLEREFAAEQRLTGGMRPEDKKFNDALKLVTDLSKTAVDAWVDIKGVEKGYQEKQAVADYNRYKFGGNLTAKGLEQGKENLGGQRQANVNDVIGLEQDSIATYFGLTGDAAAELAAKRRNPFYDNRLTQAVLADLGKNYVTEQGLNFEKAKTETPDKEYWFFGKKTAIKRPVRSW